MATNKPKHEKIFFQPTQGPKSPERLEWEAIKAAAQKRERENRLRQECALDLRRPRGGA